MKIAAIKKQELFEYLIRMMMSGSPLVALARVLVLNEILFASLRNTQTPNSRHTIDTSSGSGTHTSTTLH